MDILRSLIELLLRRHSLGVHVLRAGLAAFVVVVGGLSLSISIPTSAGKILLSWGNENLPDWLIPICVGLPLILIFFGAWLIFSEHSQAQKLKVYALEIRGMRDWNPPPLIQAIPAKAKGQREHLLVDLRQNIEDGRISNPDAAMRKILSIPEHLNTFRSSAHGKSTTCFAAGLAPIPLMFLTGVTLDDETDFKFLDWDRDNRKWISLNKVDDGNRFSISGLENVPKDTQQVIVAISASYSVNKAGARERIPGAPLVSLDLQNADVRSNWSEKKQVELGKQYLDMLIKLADRQVKTIHLFMAGPSSLVYRFGSLYDKRNLPELIVYQYDQTRQPPFTWGIKMPAGPSTSTEFIEG